MNKLTNNLFLFANKQKCFITKKNSRHIDHIFFQEHISLPQHRDNKIVLQFPRGTKRIIPPNSSSAKQTAYSKSYSSIIGGIIAVFFASFVFEKRKQEEKEPVKLFPTPNWVATPPSFSGDIGSIPPDSHGCRSLSFSYQFYTPSRADYTQKVFQVANEEGAKYLAKFPIEFDPQGETITFHEIQVLRGGKVVDIHPTQSIKNADEELECDRDLRLSLGKLQIGDIVTFSYSKEPTRQAKRSQAVKNHIPFLELEPKNPTGIVHARFIYPTEMKVSYKTYNGSIQPRIATLANNHTECVWEMRFRTSKLPDNAMVHISPFVSWQEIAQIETQYNLLPSNFKNHPPSNIHTLVKKWKGETQDPLELATKAIRFVQNRISYGTVDASYEGYRRPVSPEICLKKMQGDCKDKSFLLYALLNLLDIDAKIVLVAADEERAPHLNTYLPDPQFFDHHVLQFTINGTTRWVDPTMENKASSLENDIFPEYHWGLVLDPATQKLTAIPKS